MKFGLLTIITDNSCRCMAYEIIPILPLWPYPLTLINPIRSVGSCYYIDYVATSPTMGGIGIRRLSQ